MPIPAIIGALLQAGLPILASAVASKGQEVIEEKLGVKLPSIAELASPETQARLKQLELDHEEFLLTNALENRKLDQQELALEYGDLDSARKREVALAQANPKPWWLPSFLDILTLIVVVGGAWMLVTSVDVQLQFVVVGQIASVLAYYYGKSSQHGQDNTLLAKVLNRGVPNGTA